MKKVIENVYQINLGAANCFAVVEPDGVTLIDTGDPNSAAKIFAALATIGKQPSDIKQIVLTHLHPDHAGSAAALQQQLNVPILAHRIDAELLEKGIMQRQPIYPSSHPLRRIIYWLFIKNDKPPITPMRITTHLEDNDILPILGGATAILTPGHSAGHIVLFFEKEGLLIAGDSCDNLFGLGHTIVYENPELGNDSLRKIAKLDFETACFGHGNPIQSKANQLFMQKFG
jgi:glyoxylase-like metal-dependent hydrolase (beta-lactamase superfamily II)